VSGLACCILHLGCHLPVFVQNAPGKH
jgi:hypothetical protein